VPFFAVGAILAAGSIRTVIAYTGIGVLNAINLHAVLAAPLRIKTGSGGAGFGGGGANGPSGRGSGPAGGGFGGAFDGGGFGSSFTSIQLPFADLARSQIVVDAVAVGQTLALIGLLAAWVVILVRAPDRAAAGARIPATAAPSPG
jgi:hypothetical protein